MNSHTDSPIQIGLERIQSDYRHVLEGRSFGLVMNRASIDCHVNLACDVLDKTFPGQLKCLMTPQHGLWGEQQANMIETAHDFHRSLRVPIYSLYSETRRPTSEMLKDLDCLIIDLQDVGTRVYTFIWSMLYCLQECAGRGVSVVVLDRPNPIGGEISEGPVLDLKYRSFVGESAIPMRHGLTIGELASMFNQAHNIHADLTVIPMQGWKRSHWFDDLRRVWVPPSPNMPAVQTAVAYPGQVLLEGTNLSEGRGTTTPFEIAGAPFVDPEVLASEMSHVEIPGVRFLPIRFTPSFDKWKGQSCGGISIHVTDRHAFRSYRMAINLITTCFRHWPSDFSFTPPPYEYEFQLAPIDIISGSDALRISLSCDKPASDIWNVNDSWQDAATSYLLY